MRRAPGSGDRCTHALTGLIAVNELLDVLAEQLSGIVLWWRDNPGRSRAWATDRSDRSRGYLFMQDLAPQYLTLFLCGDVMTGRGVDQILPHPSQPQLYETWVDSALEYVELAERAHGPIKRPVEFAYIWGDALAELDRRRPELRIVNLETAVTTSNRAWRGKGIHYRMHPGNVGCLTVAGVDCCVLANNHTLDWGRSGLEETLRELHRARICTVGAGMASGEACAPVRLQAGGVEVLVFACGATDSGVPLAWRAAAHRPGLCVLEDYSRRMVDEIAARVRSHKQTGNLVVMSLHWGENWGYAVPEEHRSFARRLIDEAGVDVVYGHSSHHPKAIEIHRGKLILYGCGDFINDYEGIAGYESYRSDLGLMYFPTLESGSGQLKRLELVVTRIHRLRVNLATHEEAQWMCAALNRDSSLGPGARFESVSEQQLVLKTPRERPG